jgi:hypothetical protein
VKKLMGHHGCGGAADEYRRAQNPATILQMVPQDAWESGNTALDGKLISLIEDCTEEWIK